MLAVVGRSPRASKCNVIAKNDDDAIPLVVVSPTLKNSRLILTSSQSVFFSNSVSFEFDCRIFNPSATMEGVFGAVSSLPPVAQNDDNIDYYDPAHNDVPQKSNVGVAVGVVEE